MKLAYLTLGSLMILANASLAEAKVITVDPRNPGEDPCGMAAFEPYLEMHIDEVPEELKERDKLRILPPGSIITMDMRLERLNVYLDDDGIIERLRCG